MKQYDFVRAWSNDASYDIDGPVIVLSMKELRELWEAGRAYEQDERMNNFFNRPDFNKFLASKGITIP